MREEEVFREGIGEEVGEGEEVAAIGGGDPGVMEGDASQRQYKKDCHQLHLTLEDKGSYTSETPQVAVLKTRGHTQVKHHKSL